MPNNSVSENDIEGAHITISFEISGAAFEETSDGEYRRIFAKIANRIAEDVDSGRIADVNGNTIGGWRIFTE